MRLVKVTTVTYVPAYTPEDYLSWQDMRAFASACGTEVVDAYGAPLPEVPTPATIEDCVAVEQALLNDPASDLCLGLYTETEVVNPQVVLELMPEGFTIPDEFERKTHCIYLDQMERQPV